MAERQYYKRDELGRFAKLDRAAEIEQAKSESVEQLKKRLAIPLDFFAEKGIKDQTPAQLRKGMRRLEALITEHEYKINNPEKVWRGWNTFTEARKAGELRKWRREINAFKNSILNRQERLKEYDEPNSKCPITLFLQPLTQVV